MLTRSAKKVLKAINKDDFIYNDIEQLKVLFPKYTEKSIKDDISYLHDSGYVKAYFADNYVLYLLEVTYDGMHYKEFQWLKIKAFITKSVLVPILVAFITSLITLWLKQI